MVTYIPPCVAHWHSEHIKPRSRYTTIITSSQHWGEKENLIQSMVAFPEIGCGKSRTIYGAERSRTIQFCESYRCRLLTERNIYWGCDRCGEGSWEESVWGWGPQAGGGKLLSFFLTSPQTPRPISTFFSAGHRVQGKCCSCRSCPGERWSSEHAVKITSEAMTDNGHPFFCFWCFFRGLLEVISPNKNKGIPKKNRGF